MYAAYTPFGFTLQVPLVQIGKLLRGPKKHFFPHFFSITVRACPRGACRPQPLQGIRRRRRLRRVRRRVRAII